MPRAWSLDSSFGFLGRRIPVVVGLLVGLTLGLSVLGSVAARSEVPLLVWGALIPAEVWHGQVWRVVTWIFFETDALGLIFGLLILGSLGTDVCQAWGPRRFLGTYLGIVAATGVTTSLLALVGRAFLQPYYLGVWPVVEAIIIAWALQFPYRDLLIYFVLPLRGRNLIYATLGGTLLFALLNGPPSRFVPHFIAEGLMLAYLGGGRNLWLRIFPRKVWSPPKRPSTLRAVEKSAREEPPRWLH